jgi:GTPase
MSDTESHAGLHATAEAPMRTAVILPWQQDGQSRDAESRLAEAVELSRSIGLDVVHTVTLPLRAAQPATLLGSGQVASLGEAIAAQRIGLAMVDAALSPVQQRNLERAWGCKVIDRTGLILDIFGERARTREGALQVELAHLQYQRSRLVRSWTHLGRQRGGFGFLGGPGETQIEADRRLIGERIARLRQEIGEVRRTRGLHREARRRVPFPVIALVGYTNAGKSTLFNALVKANAYAANQLFATLDTTTRSMYLGSVEQSVSLSDTVGFIRDLPHKLVEAFRATLQEAAEADLLLHVVDAASPVLQEQRDEVERVLAEIGAADVPQVLVYNKLDRLDAAQRPEVLVDALEGEHGVRTPRVFVSALTGEGLDALRGAIADALVASRDAQRDDVERDARFESPDNDDEDDSHESFSPPSSSA